MTSTHFSLKPLTATLITLMPASMAFAQTDPDSSQTQLTPVTVQADLRQSEADDMATSLHIYDSVDLQDQGASHTDDILLTTPNVNISNQSARARHIQIRGMGARDDYTGAPNASVGFAMDGMDFSGIGGVGNLFDVKQVEILRGPQNTRYGQSTIGGLINIQTNDPTPYRESMVETSLGEYGHTEVGLMTSGPVSDAPDSSQYRLAVFKHKSDGFYENDTLNRNDTNQKDELTLRGKLRVFANEDTTVDMTLLHANFNNGYDVWSKDNSFTTKSNQPGKDDQKSNAGSIKVTYSGNRNFDLVSLTSLGQHDRQYNFDGDWEESTEQLYLMDKKRSFVSQDFRLVSKQKWLDTFDWLVGLSASRVEEENTADNFWDSGFNPSNYEYISSDYEHKRASIYGELSQQLNQKDKIVYTTRVERSSQTFSQDKKSYRNEQINDRFSPSDTLWGGSIHLHHAFSDNQKSYLGVTRGYKAGGFNAGTTQTATPKFDPETLLNYEIGLKSNWLDQQLNTNVVAFYMDRNDPQFDGYTVQGSEYIFYTENLDSAKNYGLETEFQWQHTPAFSTFGALGLLYTEVEGTPANSEFSMSGRDQAHAPSYQFHFGAQYRHASGFFARAAMRGMDDFYFDNVNNASSDGYKLYNARIGYEAKDWEVYAWGKNLTDERYATRGFYNVFYNEKTYIRLGDPRQFGLTARVYF